MSERTEMMVINTADVAAPSLLNALENPAGKLFCSIENDGTRKSAVKVYNAINGAAEQLSDHLNEVLEIVDVVAHPLLLANPETGETNECLRTVLLTADGVGYQAVSEGIVSSLSKIFSIVGMPTGGAWREEPVKVKPVQLTTSNKRKVLTLEMVE